MVLAGKDGSTAAIRSEPSAFVRMPLVLVILPALPALYRSVR